MLLSKTLTVALILTGVSLGGIPLAYGAAVHGQRNLNQMKKLH